MRKCILCYTHVLVIIEKYDVIFGQSPCGISDNRLCNCTKGKCSWSLVRWYVIDWTSGPDWRILVLFFSHILPCGYTNLSLIVGNISHEWARRTSERYDQYKKIKLAFPSSRVISVYFQIEEIAKTLALWLMWKRNMITYLIMIFSRSLSVNWFLR